MAIYFKLSDDGKKALVAKTLVEKDLSEKEFKERAKEIPLEELVKRLPEKKAEKVLAAAARLQELKEMKVTSYGRRTSSNPSTRTTSTSYWIGGKVFVNEVGENAEYFEREEALQYGKEFYGEDFMKEHNIDDMAAWNFEYYKGDKVSGVKQIAKEEYDAVQEEIQVLTSAVSLNKIMKKDSGKR